MSWLEELDSQGRVIAYDDLPHEYKKALLTPNTPYSDEDAKYPIDDTKWFVGTMPISQLIGILMNVEDMMEDWGGDWDAYHDWYMDKFAHEIKYEGVGEEWPIILDNKYIIDDGWHRLHRYYDEGLELIPIIYSADEFDKKEGLVPICSYCNKVGVGDRWIKLTVPKTAKLTHSVCPSCMEKVLKDT